MIRDPDLAKRLQTYFLDDDTTGWTVFDFVYRYGSSVQALVHARLFYTG